MFFCRASSAVFSLLLAVQGCGSLIFHLPLPSLFPWAALQETAPFFKWAFLGESSVRFPSPGHTIQLLALLWGNQFYASGSFFPEGPPIGIPIWLLLNKSNLLPLLIGLRHVFFPCFLPLAMGFWNLSPFSVKTVPVSAR